MAAEVVVVRRDDGTMLTADMHTRFRNLANTFLASARRRLQEDGISTSLPGMLRSSGVTVADYTRLGYRKVAVDDTEDGAGSGSSAATGSPMEMEISAAGSPVVARPPGGQGWLAWRHNTDKKLDVINGKLDELLSIARSVGRP